MADTEHADHAITMRQREVGLLLRDGVSIREIAERLTLSIWTVRMHVRNLHAKTGTRDLISLVRWSDAHLDCCFFDP